MTVIVANIGKKEVHADSFWQDGQGLKGVDYEKARLLVGKDGQRMLVAEAGEVGFLEAFLEWLGLGAHPSAWPSIIPDENVYLVMTMAITYSYYGGGKEEEKGPYALLGSGSAVARGALDHVGPKEAVESAIRHAVGCGGVHHVWNLEKQTHKCGVVVDGEVKPDLAIFEGPDPAFVDRETIARWKRGEIAAKDSTIFGVPETGRLCLGPLALGTMAGYVQDVQGKLEAGGVLLGRLILDSSDAVVDKVTGPMDGDVRTRQGFSRKSDLHQKEIDSTWRDTEGTCCYLGEWHTHAEATPKPSEIDLDNWKDRFHKDRHHLSRMFFVIVGTSHTAVWEYDGNQFKSLLDHSLIRGRNE